VEDLTTELQKLYMTMYPKKDEDDEEQDDEEVMIVILRQGSRATTGNEAE